MVFLITRPNYDPTTKYFASWSEKLIYLAEKKGKKIVDLQGNKATRKELSGRISKLNPSLVILNGHGNDNSIAGQDDEILIKVGENEHLLHSRIVYAVSCCCGKKLGPKSVEKGGKAFVGYDDDFVFVSDRRFLNKPLLDKRAKPFMESSNQVAISLLKGHRAEDASLRSKEMFKENYKKLLSSEADPDSLQDARLLWWNMKHQVCLGNVDARVE